MERNEHLPPMPTAGLAISPVTWVGVLRRQFAAAVTIMAIAALACALLESPWPLPAGLVACLALLPLSTFVGGLVEHHPLLLSRVTDAKAEVLIGTSWTPQGGLEPVVARLPVLGPPLPPGLALGYVFRELGSTYFLPLSALTRVAGLLDPARAPALYTKLLDGPLSAEEVAPHLFAGPPPAPQPRGPVQRWWYELGEIDERALTEEEATSLRGALTSQRRYLARLALAHAIGATGLAAALGMATWTNDFAPWLLIVGLFGLMSIGALPQSIRRGWRSFRWLRALALDLSEGRAVVLGAPRDYVRRPTREGLIALGAILGTLPEEIALAVGPRSDFACSLGGQPLRARHLEVKRLGAPAGEPERPLPRAVRLPDDLRGARRSLSPEERTELTRLIRRARPTVTVLIEALFFGTMGLLAHDWRVQVGWGLLFLLLAAFGARGYWLQRSLERDLAAGEVVIFTTASDPERRAEFLTSGRSWSADGRPARWRVSRWALF